MVNNVEVINFTFAQKINRNETTGIMVNDRITITQ